MATATKKRTSRRRQQLRTRCPLVTMGTPMKGEDGWIIINAMVPLYFTIFPKLLKYAIVRNGSYCMVARALDAALGTNYKYIVGNSIVKIIDETHKVIVRFAPSQVLRVAIRKFDKSKKKDNPVWDLQPGLQRLGPMPKSWRHMYEDPADYAKTRKKRQLHKTAKKIAARGAGRGTFVAVGGANTPRKAARTQRLRAPVTRVIMRHRGTGKKLVRV